MSPQTMSDLNIKKEVSTQIPSGFRSERQIQKNFLQAAKRDTQTVSNWPFLEKVPTFDATYKSIMYQFTSNWFPQIRYRLSRIVQKTP